MHTAIVDYRISEEELLNLNELGMEYILCPPCSELYTAVCAHPDMQLFFIDDNNVMVHKNINKTFLKKLETKNINILFSNNTLTEIYPHDIILNCLLLGDIFVHKLNSTDSALLQFMKKKTLINVKQGYTKCSTAIVNDHAIITSDISIINSLKNYTIDILYVPPGDIELPGLNYGFIGGTCGLIDKNTMAFFGDLNCYSFGNEILEFLKKHKVTPVFLKNGGLIDRGSLFAL